METNKVHIVLGSGQEMSMSYIGVIKFNIYIIA
jgi:hypothetical protein